jgi:hypothetical protein
LLNDEIKTYKLYKEDLPAKGGTVVMMYESKY